MTARRFPVPALAPRVTLEEEAAHHLLDVVRLRRGGRVVLFDGRGREAEAILVAVVDGVPVLELSGEPRVAAPPHPLHLVLACPKGGATDDALRMATEAGATDLWPVLAERSVARGDRHDRWARIARSAAQQCGRADVPAVHPLLALREAVGELPGDLDRRVAVPGAERLPPATGPAAVLVGPEGGLTAAEVRFALTEGFTPMGLGGWILRAETAAAVATALTAP